jgi:hypothetical protein
MAIAASVPNIADARASRRWGGIHHGLAVSGRRMAHSNGLRTSHAK